MVAQLRTRDEQSQSLANYLPGGRLFANKNIAGSNLRNLLLGLAGELFTADGYLRSYLVNTIPDTTVLFIDEWERALGIPDDCFNGAGDLSTRQRDVTIKLASLGMQTAQDFIELGVLFGLTIGVTSTGPFTIQVTFIVDEASIFPYTFPIPFGDATLPIMECLFNKLKPANCEVVFVQI